MIILKYTNEYENDEGPGEIESEFESIDAALEFACFLYLRGYGIPLEISTYGKQEMNQDDLCKYMEECEPK